jgi:tetratricopeptide (TPR) repeat protein
MKVCADALAKNPTNAEALVWQGSGHLFLSGQLFQKGNFEKGSALWQKALDEMNRAVKWQPDNIGVLIPRGATLLNASRFLPQQQQIELLKTGVADYEKVLRLQQAYFNKLSTHAQGELLSALADGWYRLGDAAKARLYNERIARECTGSSYAKKAEAWLEGKNAKSLNQSANTSCVGCHSK